MLRCSDLGLRPHTPGAKKMSRCLTTGMGWLNGMNNNSSSKKGGGMMWILLLLAACCCVLCLSSSAAIALSKDVREMLGLDGLFGDNDTPPPTYGPVNDEESTEVTTGGDAWVCPVPAAARYGMVDTDGKAWCYKRDKDFRDSSKTDYTPLAVADQITADNIMKKLESIGQDKLLKRDGKWIRRETCPCPLGMGQESITFIEADSNNKPKKMHCYHVAGRGTNNVCRPKCPKSSDGTTSGYHGDGVGLIGGNTDSCSVSGNTTKLEWRSWE